MNVREMQDKKIVALNSPICNACLVDREIQIFFLYMTVCVRIIICKKSQLICLRAYCFIIRVLFYF